MDPRRISLTFCLADVVYLVLFRTHGYGSSEYQHGAGIGVALVWAQANAPNGAFDAATARRTRSLGSLPFSFSAYNYSIQRHTHMAVATV